MSSFPVFRDALSTIANWAPKLADIYKKITSFISYGIWKLEVWGYGALVVDSYYPLVNTYVKIGRLVFFFAQAGKITLSGSGELWLIFNLPVPPDSVYRVCNFLGRGENGGSTIQLLGFLNPDGTAAVQTYGATNWTTGSDRSFIVNGFYLAEK